MKKPLYGLNDASRKFWLKVREVFDECGLRILDGDEVFYFRHDKNGNLDGMVSSHVDDFILAGTDKFLEKLTRKIAEKLEISKLEDNEFRFAGMDVEKDGDVIILSTEYYVKSFGKIEIRKGIPDDPLTKVLIKVYRKYAGNLTWLASNTRPDLAIHVLNSARKQKNAVFKDLRNANRIVEKIGE